MPPQPVAFTWPAWITEIEPPHVHMHVDALVSAGTPPTDTFGEPGVHGAAVAGMQGWGVSTPEAADVAAATCGLDGVMHIPNGMTFAIGMESTMRARS